MLQNPNNLLIFLGISLLFNLIFYSQNKYLNKKIKELVIGWERANEIGKNALNLAEELQAEVNEKLKRLHR